MFDGGIEEENKRKELKDFRRLDLAKENMDEFYRLAEKRNEVMASKVLERGMKKEEVRVIILGGYHASGVKDILRASGVSFDEILPRSSEKNDKSLYQKRVKLQGERFLGKSLEKGEKGEKGEKNAKNLDKNLGNSRKNEQKSLIKLENIENRKNNFIEKNNDRLQVLSVFSDMGLTLSGDKIEKFVEFLVNKENFEEKNLKNQKILEEKYKALDDDLKYMISILAYYSGNKDIDIESFEKNKKLTKEEEILKEAGKKLEEKGKEFGVDVNLEEARKILEEDERREELKRIQDEIEKKLNKSEEKDINKNLTIRERLKRFNEEVLKLVKKFFGGVLGGEIEEEKLKKLLQWKNKIKTNFNNNNEINTSPKYKLILELENENDISLKKQSNKEIEIEIKDIEINGVKYSFNDGRNKQIKFYRYDAEKDLQGEGKNDVRHVIDKNGNFCILLDGRTIKFIQKIYETILNQDKKNKDKAQKAVNELLNVFVKHEAREYKYEKERKTSEEAHKEAHKEAIKEAFEEGEYTEWFLICLYNLINEEDAEKKDSLALIFLKLLEKEEEIKKKIDELREKTYENIISLVMNCIFNKEAEKNEKDIKDFLIEKVGKLYTSKNLKGKEVQNKKEIKEDKITSLLGKKNSFDERVYFDKKKMIQEFSINAFDAFELPLNKINKLKIKNIKIYKSEEAYDVKYKIDGDSFCVALGKDLLSLSSKDNVLDMLLKAILNYGLEEKYQRKKGKDEVFCQEAALDEIYKEKPEFWFFIKGINAFVKKTLFKKGEIYKPFFKDKEELNDFFKSVCYYHNEAILYSKNPIKFFKKYFKFKGLYFDEIVDILNEDIEELSDIKYKKIKELISNIPRLKVYKFNSKEKLKGIRHEIVKNLQDNSDFYNIFLAEDFIDIITHMNVSSLTLKKIVEIFINAMVWRSKRPYRN